MDTKEIPFSGVYGRESIDQAGTSYFKENDLWWKYKGTLELVDKEWVNSTDTADFVRIKHFEVEKILPNQFESGEFYFAINGVGSFGLSLDDKKADLKINNLVVKKFELSGHTHKKFVNGWWDGWEHQITDWAFELNVAVNNPAPAPEPATWIMGLTGVAAVIGSQVWRSRRTKQSV